jgi:secondary thiamine-phosphate synthase enzyme
VWRLLWALSHTTAKHKTQNKHTQKTHKNTKNTKQKQDALDRLAPEGGHYRHLDEGPDDMPAHVKSSMMGASLTLPVSRGRLALGTWQGIYLNEHRNFGGSRSIVVTVQGVKRADGRKYSAFR